MIEGEGVRKRNRIYEIRGIAVIAAVVSRQQWILHESEAVQLLSLYSVTTPIFLMGVTKALSLKSRYGENCQCEKILVYSLKSMSSTACAYIVASFFYLYTIRRD